MENPIALAIGIAGISAMVTVAAYGQMNTPLSNDGAEADKGEGWKELHQVSACVRKPRLLFRADTFQSWAARRSILQSAACSTELITVTQRSP